MRALPGPSGLYQPGFEHDACGVAFVVDMHGRPSHAVVQQGLEALCNLEHRGATGTDANTGDGAGILIQMPDGFLRAHFGETLPRAGEYGAGLAFLPREGTQDVVRSVEKVVEDEGMVVLGWREVPFDDSMIGPTARSVQPLFRQLVVGPGPAPARTDTERQVFMLRKRLEREVPEAYFPSLSTKTLVYKGMLTAPQLLPFFPDLTDPRLESALALVHSRFSTNTFPSWPLAHPYRLIAHNGEINTIEGNRNWMRAREALVSSPLLPEIERIFPICTPGDPSDSASFDEVLELLYMGGRSLPHAVLMMVPEAWENHTSMDPARRAFYRYHSSLMEAWDGPAAVCFTDGTVIGAVLDRNGLRPLRYWVTAEGLVVMASEAGVLDIPADQVVQKGRLQPGRMFLVDTSKGRIIDDDEIKTELAAEHPYEEWLEAGIVHMDDLPPRRMLTPQHASVVQRQRSFGYTEEELRLILAPLAEAGDDPLGSMGTDTPIAVLSERPRLVFDYFSQLFAQVTNPPLDAIREVLVTSMSANVGPERNLLEPTAESCRQITLPFPVIDNEELAKLRYINEHGETPGFKAVAIDGLYPVAEGGEGLRRALEGIRAQVSESIAGGANIVILSDRFGSADMAPIPSLLLTSAVHHHLIRNKTRTQVGLIVEAGDAREVHHIALLIGYGAAAVNPYLAFESIDDMIGTGQITGVTRRDARYHCVKALGKGVLKVMSKRGISTVPSYTGAQVFEAIGLGTELVNEYFAGTVSRLGGIGLEEIAAGVAARHRQAWPDRPEELAHRPLEIGGEYQWRREGEYHLFNPETVYRLQHSTRARRYEIFKEYTRLVDDQANRLATLRGLFRFRSGERPPVPIDEVEDVSSIVRRFSTGAMSYGSISAEAHETLAIAMNRLGARSNTGEGGEDPDRFTPDANGDLRRSAIKQVASGRFGVTSEYLVNADDLQIKISQGAKPGEGGELLGKKVYPWIARTRHTTPGVGLISPPPHHDIYSIEDIKQLIHDLKCSNPKARVHVKLVAEVGVGTVAAGVCKAKSDVVLISGHDGGTGAAKMTSIKHAGAPWELGLAETQQTLMLNGLRDRIVVQVDGQLKTGRDVVIAALLGAEEFGFATAPLVVSGCVMMRVCHLDTCPVGVATQNPELRKRFSGKPEFVVTFFEYIAQEVRELLAELGFRTMDEAIGRVDALDTVDAIEHWKAQGLDLSPILVVPDVPADAPRRQVNEQDHGLDAKLDTQLIELSRPALDSRTPVSFDIPVRNVDRTVGTLLGYEVTSRFGGEGLPDDTIVINMTGSAGQSFGAFLPKGITLRLHGDSNDYLGKGLSGGRLVVHPPEGSTFPPETNVVAGNVILYGATGGEVFINGLVGERFCVRNSGATAVVEGVGDHGCEYMTGGRVVVLGPTGRNFAAGMSGGIAYIYDPEERFTDRLNTEFVELEPMDGDDLAFLAEIIDRHRGETGSALAGRILDDWDRTSGSFVKVMPRDYKRVLETLARAEAEGRSADEAIMEMMGAKRG